MTYEDGPPLAFSSHRSLSKIENNVPLTCNKRWERGRSCVRSSWQPGHGHAAKQAVVVAFEVAQFGDFDALRKETAGKDCQKRSAHWPDPIDPPTLPLSRNDCRSQAVGRIRASA